MNAQRTLRRPISCAGIGLHSGKKVSLSLKPAPSDFGIRFRRSDLGGVEVAANISHLGAINLATGLTCDTVNVSTVEHLMAALISLGVDNAIVELNSAEVPIMDGSAAPFIYLIHEAGIKRIAVYPSDHFKVTYSIAFDHPLLRHQSRTIRLNEETFVDEIAPARTFGFLKEVEWMRQQGLALGGSLENAIVIGDTGILNNSLRFDDEFVRHKILDVIGDMALIGHPLIGHLVAHRGGHALHTEFAAMVLQDRDAWTLVEMPLEPATAHATVAHAARSAALSSSARAVN